jgi:hypothetical protein
VYSGRSLLASGPAGDLLLDGEYLATRSHHLPLHPRQVPFYLLTTRLQPSQRRFSPWWVHSDLLTKKPLRGRPLRFISG